MLNESVKALLKSHLWDLATCGRDGEPNVVPVTFKEVTEEGKLTVGDVFLETTLENLRAGGKIAVSVYDGEKLEGCQIKGTAEYLTAGPVVEAYKKQVEAMFRGAAAAKGALVITPREVIVTTPGPDNKKRL